MRVHYLHIKCMQSSLVKCHLVSLHLQKAMEVIGFLPDEISAIFELLAAILNIGNVTFEGYSLPNGTDACRMSTESVTCRFAEFESSIASTNRFPVIIGWIVP